MEEPGQELVQELELEPGQERELVQEPEPELGQGQGQEQEREPGLELEQGQGLEQVQQEREPEPQETPALEKEPQAPGMEERSWRQQAFWAAPFCLF